MFRWFALIAFIGTIGISALYRRRARVSGEAIARTAESPLLIAGRVVIALPLFAAILVYLLNPRWMSWAEFSLPPWARWVGVIVGLLTIPAAYWVFTSLGKNVSETVFTKRDHVLVTTGPYRWIRHPLYATGSSLLLAIGLMAANWLILSFSLVALILIRVVVIPLEERALVAKFGADYEAYIQHTGALWPRLFSNA